MSKDKYELLKQKSLSNVNYPDYKTIGLRIKKARKDFGITQSELSEILNYSPEYQSKLENGKIKISFNRLYQLAYLLDLDILSLLSGTNKYSPNYLADEVTNLIREESPEFKEYVINTIINAKKLKRNIL